MERRREMKRFGFFAIALAVLLGAFSPAFAQQEKAKAPELKQEMVRLKYAKPQEVQNLLRPYQNPFGQISWNPGNDNLLVISDTPETLSRILAVIKEIDVKPVDLLFTVQLVLGSEAGDSKTDEALQNDPLIAELKKLLRYKSFTLLDSNLIRTLNQGKAEISLGRDTEFDLVLRPRFIQEEKNRLIQMEVRLRRIDKEVQLMAPVQPAPNLVRATTLIETQLTMKSGEKTVVGVSKLDGGDKGLILILSGKVID
jgi:hypothetical protein